MSTMFALMRLSRLAAGASWREAVLTGPPTRQGGRRAAGALALWGIALGILVWGRVEPAHALAAAPVPRWTGGQVPICFKSRASSIEAEWVKEALRDSWSAVAQIDFLFWNACPYPKAEFYIKISWTPDRPGDGWGVGGNAFPEGKGRATPVILHYCYTTACKTTNGVDYEEAIKSVAVHEIGHKLGFAHEHQRTDRTLPPGCLRNPTSPDEEERKTLIFLTSYYDPDSIMNYCRGYDGQNGLGYQTGYKAADRISSGDAAGAQEVYGRRFPYWLAPSVNEPLQ